MVSINNLESNSSIELYPNPSNGIVHIKSKEAMRGNMVVLSSLGQQVVVQKLNNTLQTSIDLSDFKAGIYYMKIGDSTTARVAIY